MNVTKKRHAVAVALAASTLPPLVMARGHKINQAGLVANPKKQKTKSKLTKLNPFFLLKGYLNKKNKTVFFFSRWGWGSEPPLFPCFAEPQVAELPLVVSDGIESLTKTKQAQPAEG